MTVFSTELGTIRIQGENVRLVVETPFELLPDTRARLFEEIEQKLPSFKHSKEDLSAFIGRIQQEFLSKKTDSKIAKFREGLLDTAKQGDIATYLSEGCDIPADKIEQGGVSTTFEMIEKSDELPDLPKAPSFETSKFRSNNQWKKLSRYEKALAIVQEKTGVKNITEVFLKVNQKKNRKQAKKIRESILGVYQSLKYVKDYRQTTTWGGKTSIIQDRYIRNSPYNEETLQSSFDRFATTPTMMRVVEEVIVGQSPTQTETIAYTGRVAIDDKEEPSKQARQMAETIFLNEIRKGNRGKGITVPDPRNPQNVELTFAVQSLVNMSPLQSQKAKFDQQKEAYEALLKKGPLKISYEGIEYTVNLKAVPIFSNQFNLFLNVEKVVDPLLSGELQAKKATEEGQKIFFNLKSMDQSTVSIQNLLTNSKLPAWEQVLLRIYLCDLANIPLILHCMSSVDRTGVALALASAFQQFKSAGKLSDFNPGQGNIAHELLKDTDFRQLVLASWVREIKSAEYSRGDIEKGFKLLNSIPGLKGLTLNPALNQILPAELTYIPVMRKVAGVVAIPLAAVASAFILVLSFWLAFRLREQISKVNKKSQELDVPTELPSYRAVLWALLKSLPKFIWNIRSVVAKPIFHKSKKADPAGVRLIYNYPPISIYPT